MYVGGDTSLALDSSGNPSISYYNAGDDDLKYAGYDYLVISGQAPHPVYLWIDDDRVEIRQAQHLCQQVLLAE